MAVKSVFKIDLQETFPTLARAPIVEAVIHWQARAQNVVAQDWLASELERRLPQFQSREPIQFQQVNVTGMFAVQDAAPVVCQQHGWAGFRLTSPDSPHSVQFERDGVVFTRTQQYNDWEQFSSAAKEVWRVFLEIAAPVEIQRLGVRFINHLATATAETLPEFLRDPPTCPSNLPLREFLYQSTFSVPEHPFEIRVIKVMQPIIPEIPMSSGLFIDCDVFTTKPMACDETAVNELLVPMQWLKNKIFFSLLTDEAVQSFR